MACLLIIDVQNDFLDNGPFALANSRSIIPKINAQLEKEWDLVVASRDWHPADHISFASTQKRALYAPITLTNGSKSVNSQAWPTHCVQGTPGAEFDPELDQSRIDLVIDKGTDKDIECFSAFRDVFGASTGLESVLREKQIDTVYISGVVTEYCVRHTALDALDLGFKTVLLRDSIFAITQEGSQSALSEMLDAGCEVSSS